MYNGECIIKVRASRADLDCMRIMALLRYNKAVYQYKQHNGGAVKFAKARALTLASTRESVVERSVTELLQLGKRTER